MGKTLFTISTAALMVAFIAGWAVSDTQARIAPAETIQVDTFEI
jgi:predicted Co/Zn/Cd cation transporter (cation efflux family)